VLCIISRAKVIKLKTPHLAPFAVGFPLLLPGLPTLFVSPRGYYLFFYFLFLPGTELAVGRVYQSGTAFLALHDENTIQQKFAPAHLQ